ncbi:MAG: bifunctional 4-hydroxy-2-oxoglutarate aldolase/2-dehydro-3-deoxy-phosphogluconate aldolase [Bacteroidota bacterium]
MNKTDTHSILQEIGLLGIVPVIAIRDARHARGLGGALLAGGLACAEVTFRTSAALEAIRELTTAYPEMLVGAGTVLTTEQAGDAKQAGARFIVSPGLNPSVVEYCLAEGMPITPGVLTPTEVEAALGLGLQVVKFFPAEASGGLKYLKAISAPYTSLKFIPTGGIDRSNLLQYLRFPRTLACGGSWMVKADLIAEERFSDIEAITSDAVAELLGFELQRGEGPAESKREPGRIAEELSREFGMRVRVAEARREAEDAAGDGPSALRGDTIVRTHFIERALYYLLKKGIEKDGGAGLDEAGKPRAVPLNREVAGARVWLVQE